MAVRPIDANAMLRELRPVSFEAGHSAVLLSDVSKIMREWVERQPTLTPPNEPLTWGELGTMNEKPVYIVETEDGKSYWALVYTVSDTGALLASAIDLNDYGARELYGKSWLAYRRPPEGEEAGQ